MVTTYRRQGPPTALVIVIAITIVLGCFVFYLVGIQSLEQIANAPTPTDTPEPTNIPVFALAPSPTPVPACQYFEVNVEAGYMRECPDLTCEVRDRIFYAQQVCVYGIAQPEEGMFRAEEWYIVDLNPQGAFRDIVYIHNSLLRAVNPTPRPSRTFTPLPTITLTPTFRLNTKTATPTLDPNEATLTPTPMPPSATPITTPTLVRQEF